MTESWQGAGNDGAGNPPSDAKSARAGAKAAKAHAKAMRPWYRKKPFIFSGAIVILIIIIAAASGGGKKRANTAASSAPTSKSAVASKSAATSKSPATSVAAKSAPGCATNPPSYPGSQPKDCVALANNQVNLANTTVTATWSVQNSAFGTQNICAAVSIVNHNSSTISYNDFYWKLQTPSGKVLDPNFEAHNDLGSGQIIAHGTASGNVCFDDPGQSGTYVGIYKPDPFQSNRGIWLFTP